MQEEGGSGEVLTQLVGVGVGVLLFQGTASLPGPDTT